MYQGMSGGQILNAVSAPYSAGPLFRGSAIPQAPPQGPQPPLLTASAVVVVTKLFG